MAADFKKMYLGLAGKVDDAITLLEQGADPEGVRLVLVSALAEAEEIYMQTDDTIEEE